MHAHKSLSPTPVQHTLSQHFLFRTVYHTVHHSLKFLDELATYRSTLFSNSFLYTPNMLFPFCPRPFRFVYHKISLNFHFARPTASPSHPLTRVVPTVPTPPSFWIRRQHCRHVTCVLLYLSPPNLAQGHIGTFIIVPSLTPHAQQTNYLSNSLAAKSCTF